MCQITDSETYRGCGHKVLCHLKYGLRYCDAPNGIPFENPSEARRKHPNRFCKEETWVSKTKVFEGSCRDCRRERRERKKKRAERKAGWRGEDDDEGLTEEQRRERDEKDKDDEDKSHYDSTAIWDSDAVSDSDSAFMISDEEAKTPAGLKTTYHKCDCTLLFWEAAKLQGCFEKKKQPSSTQTTETAQGVADSDGPRGTKRRLSPDIAVPAQSRSTLRAPAPAPPTEDAELIKAHEDAEGWEFSMEAGKELFHLRKYRWSLCANCERKRVLVEEVEPIKEFISKGEGFRQRKPDGLWVFERGNRRVEGVVAVRGEV